VTRVAAIDIGTNTVLLLVAEQQADGSLTPLEERATITRLGEGVDRTRTLTDAAVARTNECLSVYAGVIRSHGVDRIAVVGTSAMRDAAGGERVRAHVQRCLGVDVRVISGDEEARLTLSGALSGLALETQEPRSVTVFDIGGGSTEVVHATLDERGAPRSIAFAQSFDVGSVRLTERCVQHDPPTNEEMEALYEASREAFAAIPQLPDPAPHVIGIAGTMTTLAAVSLGMVPYDGARVHGHMMLRREVEQCVRDLALLRVSERRQVPGLEPKRADVIVAGGSIALALIDRLSINRVRISDRGVRWGLAEELASSQGGR
jgi:exopolyphosphatase/guanosine-5'-triphosphate,3'-diphosphate pyrophosphatase